MIFCDHSLFRGKKKKPANKSEAKASRINCFLSIRRGLKYKKAGYVSVKNGLSRNGAKPQRITNWSVNVAPLRRCVR